jgi:hypothetical protein
MAKFYFLHIPKTAGTSIFIDVASNINKDKVSMFINGTPPYKKDFLKHDYIQAHIGTYPIGLVEDLTVGCMLRDPVDRSISNFLFIYEKLLKDDDKYLKYEKIEDKLRYYLFDDEFYFDHRNIQARFICNKPKNNIFNEKVNYKEWSQNWCLENDKTSFEFAKKQLDSFDFVSTTDNFSVFLKNLESWFFENYSLSFNNKNTLRANESNLYNKYTTSNLKELLQKNEIDDIINNNIIDFNLYNYIKNIS